MARNPLDDGEVLTRGGSVRAGDTLTVNLYDEHKNVTGHITIHRTGRPYAYDLADAYNAVLSDGSRQRGVEWTVLPNGELHLGVSEAFTTAHTKQLAAEAERDRLQFNHRQRHPMQEAAE